MAKASPDAGLLQGFADKDNCIFGQDEEAHLRTGKALICGKRKGTKFAISHS